MTETDSDSVIGLTLAELAFCMLFVVLLFAFAYGKEDEGSVVPLSEHESLLQDLDGARMELTAAKNRISILEEEMKAPGLPRCVDTLDLERPFLFTAVLQGEDLFYFPSLQISVDLVELREMFSSDLRRAEAEECTHSISVYFDSEIPSIAEYERGLSRLEQDFYIRRLGAYDGS